MQLSRSQASLGKGDTSASRCYQAAASVRRPSCCTQYVPPADAAAARRERSQRCSHCSTWNSNDPCRRRGSAFPLLAERGEKPGGNVVRPRDHAGSPQVKSRHGFILPKTPLNWRPRWESKLNAGGGPCPGKRLWQQVGSRRSNCWRRSRHRRAGNSGHRYQRGGCRRWQCHCKCPTPGGALHRWRAGPGKQGSNVAAGSLDADNRHGRSGRVLVVVVIHKIVLLLSILVLAQRNNSLIRGTTAAGRGAARAEAASPSRGLCRSGMFDIATGIFYRRSHSQRHLLVLCQISYR